MRGAWRMRQLLRKLRGIVALRQARRAVARFPTVRHKEPHGLPGELIVTLTSYPARYPTLGATLRSLLDQRIAADRTVLWLAEGDLAALPDDVRALEAHGLEIRTCEDLRSYKKLIPALALWPDAFFVTVDDDVYYPPDHLGGLVATALDNQGKVVAWRAHMARRGADGRVAPYLSWEINTASTRASGPDTALFPTGVGGVLYPPGSLPPEVQDRARFEALCPHGDDIWLFWMARRNGRSQVRVPRMLELIEWPDSQAVGLRVQNMDGDGNDRQIRAMEAEFGAFPFAAPQHDRLTA